MKTWKENNMLLREEVLSKDEVREELGNRFDMILKKVNCGRCRYFGFNNGKTMTNRGDSSCLLKKKKTSKLNVCENFEPINETIEELFGKTISFDYLLKGKYSETYIPCEGKLLSRIPTEKGYRVKIEKILSKDTPYNVKERLLTASHVYVGRKEIEEYAKIV